MTSRTLRILRTTLLPAGLAAALLAQAPHAVAAEPGDQLVKLPASASGVSATGGSYLDGRPGFLGGKYVMMYRDSNVVLSGKGYFQIRYEIAYFNRTGQMVMPTFEASKGSTLLHVASGGGRRMDDTKPGRPSGDTWMGNPKEGYITLPDGAEQMWQNEFYYLDGTVTLTNHERGADYNIAADPKTYDQVAADIDRPVAADGKDGWVRQGIVRPEGRTRPAQAAPATPDDAAPSAPASSTPASATAPSAPASPSTPASASPSADSGAAETSSAAASPAAAASPQAGGRDDLAVTGSGDTMPYYAAGGAVALLLGGTLVAVRRRRG